MATTQPQPIALTTTTTTTAPDEWRGFRCRDCQRLLFKATTALLHGLSRHQQLEIKCACKTLNYLMGA
jgi:phage FluMu protein Com